jgi:hypothetical protein
MSEFQRKLIAAALLLLVGCAAFGGFLSGGFLLDDYPNLAALSQVQDWSSAKSFVLSGEAGPTGRPVSLLSFALQYPSWSQYPAHFLVVNLGIHIVNAFLVYIFCRLFFSAAGFSDQNMFALFVAVLWLVLPFHVSTAAYIIQRMTLLSASFSLLSLITFLRAAELPIRSIKAWWFLFLSAITLILGVFSKENAAVLVLALLAIALFYRNKALAGMCLVSSIGLLLYMATWLVGSDQHYQFRDFDLPERLHSQAFAILAYLKGFVLPQVVTSGVFQDAFEYPESRLFSILLWCSIALTCVLCVIGVIWRKSCIAFGILIFFLLHVLESTVLPLELYFEHRNYLPLMGLCIATVVAVRKLCQGLSLKWVGPALIVSIIFINSFVAAQRASLWGQPLKLALAWQAHSPKSERAVDHAANVLLASGAGEHALKLLRQYYDDQPSPVVLLNIKLVACSINHSAELPVLVSDDFTRLKVKPELSLMLMRIYQAGYHNHCKHFERNQFQSVLAALSGNPQFHGPHGKALYVLQAMVATDDGRYDEAELLWRKVISLTQNSDVAWLGLTKLVTSGQCERSFNLMSYAVSEGLEFQDTQQNHLLRNCQ